MTTEAPAAVAEEADKTAATAEDEQQSNADDTQSSETETEDTTAEADDSQSDDTGSDEDDDKPRRKSRSRRYAERITEQSARIAALERKLEETQKAAPVVEKPKPKLDDFENIEAFEEAIVEYTADKVLSKYSKQTEAQRQSEAAANSSRESAQAYQAKMAEAKSYIPDFDEVVGEAPDMPVSSHVQGLVIESERAPELVYHFAANPEVLADMNQMSATQAAREIGRLEATLAKPTPRKQSKAPPPVKPLKGAGSTVKPLAELPTADYVAIRTKEIYG